MNESGYVEKFERRLSESIVRLVSKNDKIGIAFSGGLDSTVLAKMLIDLGYDVRGYVVGIKGCKDILQARKVAKEIGLKLKVVELSEQDIEEAIGVQGRVIKKIYDKIELTGKEKNDSLTPNAVPISFNLPLYFVAKNAGEKRIIVSQGSDEMLGGYTRHQVMSEKEGSEEMKRNIANFIKFGVSQNIETGKYWGKEFIMPYLDKEVVELCLSLPYELKISGETRKYILRKLALNLEISEDVAMHKKRAAQYGSGIIDVMKKLAKRDGHHVSLLVSEKINGSEAISKN